jgi:hypothetical protein
MNSHMKGVVSRLGQTTTMSTGIVLIVWSAIDRLPVSPPDHDRVT